MTRERRVGNDGEIIPKQKPTQGGNEHGTNEPGIIPFRPPREKRPVNPDNKAQYDFAIHCTTTALVQEYPPKIADMEEVCAACPFSKTPCRDGIILPSDEQMKDIRAILMMDEGDEPEVPEVPGQDNDDSRSK